VFSVFSNAISYDVSRFPAIGNLSKQGEKYGVDCANVHTGEGKRRRCGEGSRGLTAFWPKRYNRYHRRGSADSWELPIREDFSRGCRKRRGKGQKNSSDGAGAPAAAFGKAAFADVASARDRDEAEAE